MGPRLPAEIHALVHAINGRLGAIGTTVVHTAPVLPMAEADGLAALAEDMAAGTATHLLILDASPHPYRPRPAMMPSRPGR